MKNTTTTIGTSYKRRMKEMLVRMYMNVSSCKMNGDKAFIDSSQKGSLFSNILVNEPRIVSDLPSHSGLFKKNDTNPTTPTRVHNKA